MSWSTQASTNILNKRGHAAAYARVSTDQQREEATIGSQVEELKQTIAEAGLVLDPEHLYIDDGYTGELLARPALDQMRDAARRKEFDAVYVYDRGRLSRRFAYQEILIEELVDLGIEFVSLHDVHALTPEDRVLQSMQGVFHEYERLKIAERFRRGKLHKVRSGHFLGYVPRYGYSYHPEKAGTSEALTINPREAEVVRAIFRWIDEEKLSLRAVVRRLNELGVPPRRSRRGVWNTSTLHNMLRDRIYIGQHYYNKTEAVLPTAGSANRYRRIKKTCIRPRPREEWIELPAPAIVPVELFHRVQEQLKQNKAWSPRNTRNMYLCQGLVYCPCGQRLIGTVMNHRPYYRCTDRQHRFPLSRVCRRPGMRAELVDALVWRTVEQLMRDPATLREQAEQWLQARAKQSAPKHVERDQAAIDAQLQRLVEEEASYARAFAEGALSLETLQTLSRQIAERRARVERESAERNQQLSGSAPSWSVSELVAASSATLQSLPAVDRRTLVRHLVTKVTATKDTVVILGHVRVQRDRTAELCPANGYSLDTNTPSVLHKFDGVTEPALDLPLEFTIPVPPPNQRGRYTQEFLEELARPS